MDACSTCMRKGRERKGRDAARVTTAAPLPHPSNCGAPRCGRAGPTPTMPTILLCASCGKCFTCKALGVVNGNGSWARYLPGEGNASLGSIEEPATLGYFSHACDQTKYHAVARCLAICPLLSRILSLLQYTFLYHKTSHSIATYTTLYVYSRTEYLSRSWFSSRRR